MVTPTCICGSCRKCKNREYMRRYRVENADAIRAYDRDRNRTDARKEAKNARERLPQNRARHNAANGAWKERNPEKARAHALLAYHIREGNIERQPCAVCGDANAEGHHEDYSKPLEVQWLCRAHHAELHRSAA